MRLFRAIFIFGAGTPSAVPIVESDFVFVVVGEELGFAGCAAVLALYAALVFSGRLTASARKTCGAF